jgi:hypothetical protein
MQADRYKGRQVTGRQIDRRACRQAGTQACRQAGSQTGVHAKSFRSFWIRIRNTDYDHMLLVLIGVGAGEWAWRGGRGLLVKFFFIS